MAASRIPSPLPPRAVVAVFRAPTAEHYLPASKVLWDAGIRCFEYTLTTDGALDALVELRRASPEAHFDWLDPVFNEHLETRDGRMWVSDRPGLGFTLSDQARLDHRRCSVRISPVRISALTGPEGPVRGV